RGDLRPRHGRAARGPEGEGQGRCVGVPRQDRQGVLAAAAGADDDAPPGGRAEGRRPRGRDEARLAVPRQRPPLVSRARHRRPRLGREGRRVDPGPQLPLPLHPEAAEEMIVAIDEGTTGVRAMAVDYRGLPIDSAYTEFRQIYPQPGWVEQEPSEIWQATLEVLGKVVKDATAIGITNQRETTVVWDRKT